VTSGLTDGAAEEAEAVAPDGCSLPAAGVLTGAASAPGELAGAGLAMADVVVSSVTTVSFRSSRVVTFRTFTSNLQ